jgi:uncharacterized protein YndB with AHSA1/START domain
MNESSQPIVVEQLFAVPTHVVWDAITNRDQMVQWFFSDIPEFRPEAGFKTEFNVSTGVRDFYHLWTITEAVPGRKIVYDWRYKNLPGVGKVTFDIIEQGQQSLLRITNEGLESFPKDIPEFARESCEGGWKYFIQGNLKAYLER